MRLIKRVKTLVPTSIGWGLILLFILAFSVSLVLGAHPFLSTHAPVGGPVLVVQWSPDRKKLEKAAAFFRESTYQKLVVTGGPVERESYLSQFYPGVDSKAAIGALWLISYGLNARQVQAVPWNAERVDQTYSSALAVRQWLRENKGERSGVDVFATGPSARRSRLLFGIALADVAQVGVVMTAPEGYVPERWWASSAGVKTLMGEVLAYSYIGIRSLFGLSRGDDLD